MSEDQAADPLASAESVLKQIEQVEEILTKEMLTHKFPVNSSGVIFTTHESFHLLIPTQHIELFRQWMDEGYPGVMYDTELPEWLKKNVGEKIDVPCMMLLILLVVMIRSDMVKREELEKHIMNL